MAKTKKVKVEQCSLCPFFHADGNEECSTVYWICNGDEDMNVRGKGWKRVPPKNCPLRAGPILVTLKEK